MSTEIFTNDVIDIENLPKYEEIHLMQPHSNYWKIICINLFIVFGLAAIGVTVLIILVDEIRPNALSIIGTYLVITVLFFILFRASFNKRGYAIRTKDVIYKSGIIAESTTIIPLNRIQHIELNEGLLARIYKLSSLQIFTAGGQTGHLHISGIPINEAKSIRDLLLQKLELIEKPITETEA